MRLHRKILCVRRSKLSPEASKIEVRTSSQPVSAMYHISLISERTLLLHGGWTGCARKSGKGGGGAYGAFASSRRPERICSLSRIRRPPPYFVRDAIGIVRGGLPLVFAALCRLPLRPRSGPRDVRAVRLRRIDRDDEIDPRSRGQRARALRRLDSDRGVRTLTRRPCDRFHVRSSGIPRHDHGAR